MSSARDRVTRAGWRCWGADGRGPGGDGTRPWRTRSFADRPAGARRSDRDLPGRRGCGRQRPPACRLAAGVPASLGMVCPWVFDDEDRDRYVGDAACGPGPARPRPASPRVNGTTGHPNHAAAPPAKPRNRQRALDATSTPVPAGPSTERCSRAVRLDASASRTRTPISLASGVGRARKGRARHTRQHGRDAIGGCSRALRRLQLPEHCANHGLCPARPLAIL